MSRLPLPPHATRRIAVRMTNWVGDAVMNTPFLVRLRQIFPHAVIIAMARGNVAPVLSHHPAVDEVWAIDDRSRSGYTEAVKRLRHFRADLGFALPNSLNSAALLAAGGVRRRVAYARDGRGFLLTDPVRLRSQDLAVHEVRYYLRLLDAWDHAVEEPPLTLRVTKPEHAAMNEWLTERDIDIAAPLIGVNPAAFFGTAKRWHAERYAQAAADLRADCGPGTRVVVTGLPTERDVAQEVCAAGGEGFYNAAGDMNLRQLMAFLARVRLFLTNDSGAMHIGAALGAPTVAVFGSTDWSTTAPRSATAAIVRRSPPCAPCLLRHCPIDHRCMTAVEPTDVVQVARSMLLRTAPNVASAPD